MHHFCTYFDRHYLTRGLALHQSLLTHSRDPFTLWVLCLDSETHAALTRLQPQGVRPIRIADLEAADPQLCAVKAGRSRIEYYWTCTPAFTRYVLQQNPDIDVLTYLDADLYFYADPALATAELGNRSLLLTRHRFAPRHAGLEHTSGIFNVGLLSFRNNETGRRCLDWWRERCLEWCHSRRENGLYGDQMYLNDWPERFGDVAVAEHPGVGIAPWNLSHAGLHMTDGRLMADGQPLVYYHFHGFKVSSRLTATPAATRYVVRRDQLEWLYASYAAAVAGAARASQTPTTDETEPWLRQVAGLLDQSRMLLGPRSARSLLWMVGKRVQRQRQILATGQRISSELGARAARHFFAAAIRRYPLLGLRPLVWLALLEWSRIRG